jgi:hypothetical protein
MAQRLACRTGVRRSKRVYVAAVALLLVLAAGCAPAGGNQPPTVAFTAREFNFSGPSTVPPGVVRFRLTNGGTRAHMLDIVKLSGGKTAEDLLQAVQSNPDAPLPSYAVSIGGPNAVDPGMDSVAYAQLQPGDYAVVCNMPDDDTHRSHLSRGMIKAFKVSGKASAASAPSASVELDESEFTYRIGGTIAAGNQTIHVRNTGRQEHEAQLAQLPAGITVQQYIALNDGTGAGKGSSYGGLAGIQPGNDGLFNVYFAPGNYAFICFVTDPQTGKAHFELGQIQEFTVR